MAKITFMGAGSTVFAKNIIGDCMCREALRDAEVALYDIDGERLKESVELLNALNAKVLGNPEAKPYYGAPTVVLVFETEACKTHTLDGAAVCTNMLNAAYAVGLGSCWIHRCKQMFEMEEGKALLRQWGLPDTLTGVASLALGYADCEQPIPKPRREGYIVKV